MAVASKIRDDEIVVIDEIGFDAPKTKDMVGILSALGISGESTLIATENLDVNVYRSARNIQRVEVLPVSDLNALSVLAPRRLLITKSGLESLKSQSGS
jgi:large subunit ribosomal protein L4